ncbi:putative nucleotide-diphospho-sugar transferase [Psychroserpens mesophilus]|uniref:putative nucleotide-diphospho-sugar transferase n=1 Tax=Psychroserpens mesophilus TaxID=325473 RepID=UPI000A06BAB1|nr:putative nucleotide-diphospho-sugar transferase [Psychroserpens mesophilus]
MNICILSGRFPATVFKTPINHRIYADAHNYTYIHCNWPTTLSNNYLNKIAYVLQYIDNYDYIIWIDDDAFFMNMEKDIMDYAPKNDSFISICKSPEFKELKTYFSSGQFIVKCNSLSKQFFNEVLNTEFSVVKEWWKEDLGYYTNGDQDVMIYLLLEKEDYKGKVDLFDYKFFNSRYENLFEHDIHDPLILHFTGRGPVKKQLYLQVQDKLNLHASLVPNAYLEKYGIATEETCNAASKTQNKSFFNRLRKLLKNA